VVDGNRQTGTAHFFLATGASPSQRPQWDDSEELAIELVSPEQARRLLENGEVGTLGSACILSLALGRLPAG